MSLQLKPDQKAAGKIYDIENEVNDTLSDIYAEPNQGLQINETAMQTFATFFKNPHDSIHVNPIETISLQVTTESQSPMKLKQPQTDFIASQNLLASQNHFSDGNTKNLKNVQTVNIDLPQKQPSQLNIAILLVSIFMYIGIIVGAVLIKNPQTVATALTLLIVPYIVYLVIALRCNTLCEQMNELKTFQEYRQLHQHMVSQKPQLRFQICCYHFENIKASDDSPNDPLKPPIRQKIITHTATQNYIPELWTDESADIAGLNDTKKYIFITYEKSYYFSENSSNQGFKSFIGRNRRDKIQNYSQAFQLTGFVEEVGFCKQGQPPYNGWVFYLFTFLGLALPYSLIVQRQVSRYSVKIVKRIDSP